MLLPHEYFGGFLQKMRTLFKRHIQEKYTECFSTIDLTFLCTARQNIAQEIFLVPELVLFLKSSELKSSLRNAEHNKYSTTVKQNRTKRGDNYKWLHNWLQPWPCSRIPTWWKIWNKINASFTSLILASMTIKMERKREGYYRPVKI